MRINLSDNRFKLILILIALCSFGKTLWILNQTLFANGWDAYFYLDQIKYWYEHGQLHTSRTSFYYPFLIAIQYVTGNYVLTYKVGIAICSACITFAFGLFPYRLKEDKFLGLILAIYSISSLHLEYFAANFGKNYLGLVFLLFFLLSMSYSKNLIPQLLLLIACLFTHKLIGALAVLILGLFLIRKLNSKYIKIIVLTGIVFITAGTILLFNFERQPDFISYIPTFHLQAFLIESNNLDLFHLVEIILLFCFSFFILLYFLIKRNISSLFGLIAALLFILINFPFLKWDLMGYSYRLFILLPFISILIFAEFKLHLYVKIGLAMFAIMLLPFQGYNAKKQDPSYALYTHVANKTEKANVKSEVIIAHKSLAEFVSFKLSTDVMPWIPEYKIKADVLWRITYGISKKEIEYYGFPGIEYHVLSSKYTLLREKDWQYIMTKIEKEDADLFLELNTWKNPNQVRPNYLKKK